MRIFVKCVNTEVNILPKKIRGYAFTQDESGNVDLTIGQEYRVYGYREYRGEKFLLTLTDTIDTSTPWWMPARFYSSLPNKLPQGWITKSFGIIHKDYYVAPKEYFDATEDIEDGTEKGVMVFREMDSQD